VLHQSIWLDRTKPFAWRKIKESKKLNNGEKMNSSDIQSEISAQAKLVDSIAIDQEKVTEIDRHIKEQEKQLNDRFVHISVGQIIMHFLPPHKAMLTATKVDDNIWKSLPITKVWPNQRGMHQEISFDKNGKAFAFFYTMGEVVYDVGFVQDHGGLDSYVRILEDKRETFRVTGAPVEIKLRAFLHLKELLLEINKRGNDVTSRYAQEITNRYSKAADLNGNQ
jgi:hypothetical protein